MGRSLSVPDANTGISSIATAAGFTSGDYVYQTATDNGPMPSGAMATGAFTFNSVSTSTYSTAAATASNLTYVEQDGGSTGGQVAAKLSNGNIVFVYIKCTGTAYLGTPYFKIVDAAGTVVVAETAMDTQIVGGAHSISVCVLPNSNFAAVWTKQTTGAAYNLTYRIYSQTGTAVTSATTIGAALTVTGTGALLKIKPRSDNSFIIMTYAGSNVYFYAANAAGIVSGWGSSGAVAQAIRSTVGGFQLIDYAITSNDFVHIFRSDTVTLGSNLFCRTLNASGVQTTDVQIASNSSIFAISCILMPSGNVNVFYYTFQGSVQGIYGISWNGVIATALGRLITPSATANGNAVQTPILNSYAQGSGGNFTLFYSNFDTNHAVAYQTFNSSGVVLSGPVPQIVPGISSPVGGFKQFAIFDIETSTRVYTGAKSNTVVAPTSLDNVGGPRGIYYFSYDATTYVTNINSPVSYDFGTQGAIATGGYAKSASTPIAASFFAATTGTYSVNVPAGTNLIGKTVIEATAVQSISATTLSNGNVAILYVSDLALKPVTVVVYNTAGAVVTTIAVSASAYVATYCAIAPYANGSFAVFYKTAAGTITWKVYNSSFTQVATSTIADALSAGLDDSGLFNVASYGNGSNVAIAYRLNTNAIKVGNLSSAGTYTVVNTWGFAADLPQVIGFKSNAFSVVARDQSTLYNNYTNCTYYQTGAATWATNGPQGISIGASVNTNPVSAFSSSVPAPDSNTFCVYNVTSGTAVGLATADTDFFNANGWAYTDASAVPSPFTNGISRNCAIGYTGDGLGVMASSRSGSLSYIRVSANSTNYPTQWTAPSAVTPGLSTNITAGYGSISIAPFIGGSCVIAYIDEIKQPCFFAPIVGSFPISKTLTAGVDISVTTLQLTPESGYALRGVALTTAAPGSSGLVQTRGTASVSASYPAGTPFTNFDFRSSTSSGVRGRVTGRSVTLEA